MQTRTLITSLAALAAFQLWLGIAKAAEKGNALFTIYYVAEVKAIDKGNVTGRVQTPDGKWLKYRVTQAEHRRAHMEGTAFSRAPDGTVMVATIVSVGVWQVLPPGWAGKGNRQNPLYPYRSAAADQKIYPYGTRIYLPQADGFQTPDGKTLDGYFWVSDVGSGIKGPLRFDLFIGQEPSHEVIKKFEYAMKWRGPAVIDRLPEMPDEWDPRTPAGLARVLSRTTCQTDGSYERLKKDIKSVRRLGKLSNTCLVAFQKMHSRIPEFDHGLAMSAITLWYLTQAADTLHKGRKYVAESTATPAKR